MAVEVEGGCCTRRDERGRDGEGADAATAPILREPPPRAWVRANSSDKFNRLTFCGPDIRLEHLASAPVRDATHDTDRERTRLTRMAKDRSSVVGLFSITSGKQCIKSKLHHL